MKLIPEYCKNVIAGVMYRRKFGWYVTLRIHWRMDYRKEYKAWEEYYQNSGRTKKQFLHDVGSFEYFCGKRWGIEVLDEKTADAFLNKISKYSVSADELHSLLSENGGSEQDMEPSFYVDLDNRKFYSFFPEAASYEDFVPNGWEGKYCCFKSLIPKSEAYWDNTPDRK